MIDIAVESGFENLTRLAEGLKTRLSPAALELKAIALAAEAGKILLAGSVRACLEAVYNHPNFPSLSEMTPSQPGSEAFGGNEEERTNALLDAHQLVDEGLIQTVDIDPDFAVPTNSHSGRELVIDYAAPVHDGYTQWVYGFDTGIFHPGRFWFDVVEQEVGPVVAAFIQAAFFSVVTEIFEEIAA